jgi:hypothetical protein
MLLNADINHLQKVKLYSCYSLYASLKPISAALFSYLFTFPLYAV